ncbi:hypothetical protein AXA44_30925 [Rhodococcus sp. SC4]|nr:hypothetical protein AXA44_30925 [Rhodococcus sp. SC4]
MVLGFVDPVMTPVLGLEPEIGGRLPVFSYLLEEVETHTLVVVDLGPPPADMAAHGGHINVGSPWRSAAMAVADAGFDPAAVRWVVLSHLHWDHVYGAQEFSNAVVVVQEREIAFASQPPHAQRGVFDAAVTQDLDQLHDARRLEVISGDVEIAPGLRAVLAPGHTAGSQYILAETLDGTTIALVGDMAYRYENLLGTVESSWTPIPPSLCEDAQAWLDSAIQLADVGALPLLAHDERGPELLGTPTRLVRQGDQLILHPAPAQPWDPTDRLIWTRGT